MEVVLLVELGDEAVGAGAVAVELAVGERGLGHSRLGYAACASSGCRRSAAASSWTSPSSVRDAVADLDGAAAVLVYVPHTTAGVTINEHADPAVARDFEAALERIVSEEWPWQHVEEGEENAPTHIRAAFMGSDALVPVKDGRLALGTWQGHLSLRVRRAAEPHRLRDDAALNLGAWPRRFARTTSSSSRSTRSPTAATASRG